MTKNYQITIDREHLEEAKRALGTKTIRATIEEALRRATELAKEEQRVRAERQREYFRLLAVHGDLDVLASAHMRRRETRTAQIEDLATLSENLDVEVLKSDEMWRRRAADEGDANGQANDG
jgi:Arc/MetJ family transcription regulator